MTSFLWAQQFYVNYLEKEALRDVLVVLRSPTEAHTNRCVHPMLSFLQRAMENACRPHVQQYGPHVLDVRPYHDPVTTKRIDPFGNQKGDV